MLESHLSTPMFKAVATLKESNDTKRWEVGAAAADGNWPSGPWSAHFACEANARRHVAPNGYVGINFPTYPVWGIRETAPSICNLTEHGTGGYPTDCVRLAVSNR